MQQKKREKNRVLRILIIYFRGLFNAEHDAAVRFSSARLVSMIWNTLPDRYYNFCA